MTFENPTVIFGVVGNDIHVVANRVLQLCLERRGLGAINLGTNNMPEDFADAALEVAADAVLVSSLNGEAAHWCRDIRSMFRDRGLDDILIYLGGNVVTGSKSQAEVEEEFRLFEIDRIFVGYVDFDDVIETLIEDLNGRS